MKKLLISLSALIPIFSATSILITSQRVNDFSTQNFHQVQENIDLVPSSNDFSTTDKDDFYTLQGQNYDTAYRVYVHSNNDENLPNLNNGKDYIIKGKKDFWYDYEVKGLSLNITTLAANKTEFLKKYPAVTTSFLSMSNLWNSLKKWTYLGGKLSPYNVEQYTFNLTTENYQDIVAINSDSNHSNNEKTRLIINQTWNGNVLNIDWKLGVWCHWANGSIYNHSSIVQFTNDKYTLIAIPDYNRNIQNVHIDQSEYSNKIILKNATKVNDLNLVDQTLKAKAATEEIRNAWFKTTTIFIAYFYWIEKINKTEYAHSLTIRFLGDTAINVFSSLLLNGALFIERNLTLNITNNLLKAIYTDDFVNNITTDSISFNPNNNITYSTSKIVVPFIYLD